MNAKIRSYLTAAQVRDRYGGKSAMWLWRKLRDDPKFPRPLEISRNVRLFSVAELDRYEDELRDGGGRE